MTRGLGTLTVLFTDVVGSSAQRAQLGDDRADHLREEHDRLLHAAVASCRGTVVKGLGDGVMATFAAAADAVAAAIAIQQAIEAHRRRTGPEAALSVRVGISVGDVSTDGGDVHGSAVVEAARLCAAAGGGEILIAELVRLLARGRGEAAFEPVGPVDLRGLPEPVLCSRVRWEPTPPPSAALPLPAAVAMPPPTPFVGRDALLSELHDALADAHAGAHRTVLLAGEPGVGKTRLASQLALRAHAEGTPVLHGRCDDGLGVPYQPFAEALEHHLAHAPGTPLGRWPQELGRLVPHLAEEHDLGAPIRSDPRSEEHRLFAAVTSWLMATASAGGLVLVLDDLHWASPPTLRLLHHVLRHAPEHPGPGLLTVATYRDTDIDRDHPLQDALGELHRLPGMRRRSVEGLSEPEVLELLAVSAGHELDPTALALAAAVHGETEGNAFFVGEVLRHLVETGVVRRVDGRWRVTAAGRVHVPESVRDVITRRVSRLPETAGSVLGTAAVIGREVAVDVLVAASERSEADVLDALDAACAARLVVETGVDRYRFAHALVQTTLAEQLSASRRRRVHQRVGDAIAELHPDDLTGLAHHLAAGLGEDDDPGRAVAASLAAGQRALDRRAPGEAEHWYGQALELLRHAPDEIREVRARLGLAIARRDQGDPGHREALLDAGRRARAAGDVDSLVAAALANQRGWTSVIGMSDPERIALIEAALQAVDGPGADGAPHLIERTRLTALLASELVFADQPERCHRLADEALRLAAELDDPWARAEVMVRLCFGTLNVGDPDQTRAHALETVRAADHVGDPTLQAIGRVFLASAELTLGRWDEVERLTAESLVLAEAASPTVGWSARYQRMKLVVGALPAAEVAAESDACLALGQELGEPDATNWWAAMSACIEFFAGNLDDLADLATSFMGSFGVGNVVWHLAAAIALVEAGRDDEARAIVADLSLTREQLGGSPFPLQNAALAAVLAFGLDDPALAEQVDEVLAPHVERWPNFFLGTFGPAAYELGLARSVLGRHDEAIALLEEAALATEAVGRIPNALRIRYDLGQVLLRTGRPHDRATAVAVLGDVAAQAPAWGASGLVDGAQRLIAQQVENA